MPKMINALFSFTQVLYSYLLDVCPRSISSISRLMHITATGLKLFNLNLPYSELTKRIKLTVRKKLFSYRAQQCAGK
jgi:hypothetical protein